MAIVVSTEKLYNEIMYIGFDLDGVFIDKPPFIPKWLIEQLYRSHEKNLAYRFPSRWEMVIRKLSHTPSLRPPLSGNIEKCKDNVSKKNLFFLITSRYSFLKKETHHIIEHYNIAPHFSKIILNEQDMQPHIYKNRMLRRFNIVRYVDDDLPLLEFLAEKNPRTMFYYLNNTKSEPLSKNLFAITDLVNVFS